jgi:DNA-binding NarL/FixJ family response regulator
MRVTTVIHQNTAAPLLRVLLVEDSRILTEKILELLHQNAAIRITGVVARERDAIEILKLQQTDAVVLDLRLAQGSGFGVLQFISTLERRPHVIVLTNYGLAEYRRRTQALGAEHFLDKSRDFVRVPELLENMRLNMAGTAGSGGLHG